MTKDGYEMTLQSNYLGHFLLTNLLLDTIKSSKPSRIINISSRAHYFGEINRADLNMQQTYNKYKAFFQSHLANLLFTRALCKRLWASGVTINSVHPGK